MFKKTVAALVAVLLFFAPITTATVVATSVTTAAVIFDATPAMAEDVQCRPLNPCEYRPDPGMVFQGDVVVPNQIRVTVCHTWWNDLLAPRWWGPTIIYGNWKADLPARYSQCYEQWIVPGSEITSVPSCPPFFSRYEVSTGPMWSAGTYWLDPQTARPL